MTFGPPWYANTEAGLDLSLGLCVTAAPEKDAERDSSKTTEDLEKENHGWAIREKTITEGRQAFPTDSRKSKTRPVASMMATTLVPTATKATTPQNTT